MALFIFAIIARDMCISYDTMQSSEENYTKYDMFIPPKVAEKMKICNPNIPIKREGISFGDMLYSLGVYDSFY